MPLPLVSRGDEAGSSSGLAGAQPRIATAATTMNMDRSKGKNRSMLPGRRRYSLPRMSWE